jgi:enoyl-CoA hydratase
VFYTFGWNFHPGTMMPFPTSESIPLVPVGVYKLTGSSSFVLAEKRDFVLYVTINRPEKRNALSREVLLKLKEIFTSFRDDQTLTLAVLTGAEDKSFAAGGDINELCDVRTPEQARSMSEEGCSCLNSVRQFPLPVIAALNGDALGGGCELAVACDIRLAAGHARLGFLQGKLNITTAWGGGLDLIELLGSSSALRLLATSVLLTADQAKQEGLVDQVVSPGQKLETLIEDFIAPIREKTPTVLRGFKALTRTAKAGMDKGPLREIEAECLVRSWTDEAHWQAVDRYLNQRNRK